MLPETRHHLTGDAKRPACTRRGDPARLWGDRGRGPAGDRLRRREPPSCRRESSRAAGDSSSRACARPCSCTTGRTAGRSCASVRRHRSTAPGHSGSSGSVTSGAGWPSTPRPSRTIVSGGSRTIRGSSTSAARESRFASPWRDPHRSSARETDPPLDPDRDRGSGHVDPGRPLPDHRQDAGEPVSDGALRLLHHPALGPTAEPSRGLGRRRSIAIHGTSRPETIGQAASSGCLRATDEDLRVLMRDAPVGAPVFIRQ